MDGKLVWACAEGQCASVPVSGAPVRLCIRAHHTRACGVRVRVEMRVRVRVRVHMRARARALACACTLDLRVSLVRKLIFLKQYF